MKEIYEFGDFRVDPAEQLLLHRGQPVALTPKVFETLIILLKSEGRLIDKDEFVRQLWPGVFVKDVALAKNISYLRRALGDGKNGVDLIQTVPKRGYRFGAPVRKVSEQNASLSRIVDAISIRERPAEIEDRAIPGHWEGDLLSGTSNSHTAILVEKHSRFTILVKVPSDPG
jgi:DNA-binding winged helix-turn-helix (wHTH) protein